MNHYLLTITFRPATTLRGGTGPDAYDRVDVRGTTLATVERLMECDVTDSMQTTGSAVGPVCLFTVGIGFMSDSDTLAIEDADRIRNAPGLPPVEAVKVRRRGVGVISDWTA